MRNSILLFLLLAVTAGTALGQEARDEPPYGMEELEAYSVFVDAYKTDDYEQAINFGEWMIEAAPREIEGYDGFSLERQFDRMTKVYTVAAKEASDPTEKTQLLEKAEYVFEKTFQTFSEEEIDYFDWYIKFGRFYHENSEHLDDGTGQAVQYYEDACELDQQRFVELNDGFFAEVLLTQYASNGERDKAFEMIDEIEPYASGELTGAIDQVRESLFENAAERIEYIESGLDEAGGDERIEMLENLVDLYREDGRPEEAEQGAIELYELSPTYENTRTVADIYLSDGNYQEGLRYLGEAMEKSEEEAETAELALMIAETYQQLEDLQKAREYARQAINTENRSGEAYMRMASVYAAAISDCTGGDVLEREDRTVYWLVIDYLERAKQADPSLASNADNRIESYSEAMPSSEDKFFSGWETGDDFEIDGDLKECYSWINETTTVR